MKIVVGIATYRRRDVLSETLTALSCQTRAVDRVIIAATTVEDVDQQLLQETVKGELLISKAGLCRQRNTILNAMHDEECLLFLDDDFTPATNFLAELEQLFTSQTATEPLAVITGKVIADGILGPGFSYEESLRFLDKYEHTDPDHTEYSVHNGYGCNMALNHHIIKREQLRFDERLKIYGWLEDVDFSRQLGRHGKIIKSHRLIGVHRGVKQGRTSGRRLGFAQIVNPAYLARKGTCCWSIALRSMLRNFIRNAAGLFLPDRLVDRPGRFCGNLIGWYYLLTGRFQPEAIEKLSA